MRRLAIALVLSLAACGSRMPETRFYQLAEPGRTTEPGDGPAIAIDALETDSAYDDERIVYRLTPYRLDYYNYHRWSTPPGTMIANYLERAFEKSGRFAAVTRDPAGGAPVALGGRVVAIEEVDRSKTKWFGRLVLELTLIDTATGDVLWRQQFEENQPLPAQSPEGLAQALSTALERIANRTIPVVSLLAEKAARAHDKDQPASREARLRP